MNEVPNPFGEEQRDPQLTVKEQRKKFVEDNLPELEGQNAEFRLGYSHRFMLRVLWIKSKRFLHLLKKDSPPAPKFPPSPPSRRG